MGEDHPALGGSGQVRGGIAVLLEEDETIAGCVATVVDEFWSPFRPLTWQERVWSLITWSDGRRERIEEDYSPWILVNEIRQGRLELERRPGGEPVTFRVRWSEGDDREEAWSAHGITDEVGAHLQTGGHGRRSPALCGAARSGVSPVRPGCQCGCHVAPAKRVTHVPEKTA